MNKKNFSVILVGMIIIGLMGTVFPSIAIGSEPPNETMAAPVINEVYTFPYYPLGVTDFNTPEDGDEITVYVNLTGAKAEGDGVYIHYECCNDITCYPLVTYEEMTQVSGTANTLYKYTFPGDPAASRPWNCYQTSNNSLQYIKFQIEAYDDGWTNVAYYPDNVNYKTIFPAKQPTQVNATTTVELAGPYYPGQTLWVNGSAHYWPSTYETRDIDPTYSTVIPAHGTNVTISVNQDYNGKTDANGEYSFELTAPLTPGFYNISTNLVNDTPNQNGTQNRNVPCVSDDIQIEVLDPELNMTAVLNKTASLPGLPVKINGTAFLNLDEPAEGGMVNVSIDATGDYWNSTVDSAGFYTVDFTAPSSVGDYTINVTIEYNSAFYNTTNYSTNVLNITAFPLPDLNVIGSDIVIAGTLIEGEELTMDITFRNTGIADADNFLVTISIDGTVENSTTQSLLEAASKTISTTWPAVPGEHNISVALDPAESVEEIDETDNTAYKTFIVLADSDGDGIADNTDDDDDNDGYNDTVEAAEGTDPTDDTSFPDDLDGDFIPDSTDSDIDGDNVTNADDAFPLDDTESADYDGDGIGDNADTDDDSDGLNDDTDDPYPMDTDNDGLGNDLDTDDDNDGIPDAEDTMPLDTDNDGINNGEDTDDDGDGVDDVDDAFPMNPTGSIDTDEDGNPDDILDAPGWAGNILTEDTDDDDDGVLDVDDDEPLNPNVGSVVPGSNNVMIGVFVFIIAMAVIVVLYMYVRPKQ